MESKQVYNNKYYDSDVLKQLNPKLDAFRTYKTKDGILIGLFQGNRGAKPELDFKIKVLIPGADKIPAPPPHIFWVVDLLLKIPTYPKEVKEIVEYYISFYKKTAPFSTIAERDNYTLETVAEITSKYSHIEQPHTMSLDYVATVIELFCKCEKATPGAFWFEKLLTSLRDYMDGKLHYTEVLQAAMPGYR
jgi:hypothetical protein